MFTRLQKPGFMPIVKTTPHSTRASQPLMTELIAFVFWVKIQCCNPPPPPRLPCAWALPGQTRVAGGLIKGQLSEKHVLHPFPPGGDAKLLHCC